MKWVYLEILEFLEIFTQTEQIKKKNGFLNLIGRHNSYHCKQDGGHH